MVKRYAEVILSDPTAVEAKCTALGQSYDKGAVFCSCEEMGYDVLNLVYCRYGLSIPFLKVQEGWKIWIEPSIGNTERWIYTGIADAGEETVNSTTQLAITLLQGLMYQNSLGVISLTDPSATEAFVKGTTFLVELQKHASLIQELQSAMSSWVVSPSDGGAALQTALATFFTLPQPDYKDILSNLIFGE